MKNRFKNLSLQVKISSIYVLANLLVFIINIVLLAAVNNMSNELDMVYQENLQLNELTNALDAVQDNMTEYLNVKTSDALEEYYRSEQIYASLISELKENITGTAFDRMERNIKNMSENYLDMVSQTIEAKRGRNVEKYRVRYENATKQYQYISTYISSLNRERFQNNSENYTELSQSFKKFETTSLVVLAVLIIGNMIIITNFTSTLISPLQTLAGAADEIAKGNLEIDLIRVDSNDEIGVVAKAFNQMVISIREYIEQIRQRMEVERNLKENELRMEAHLKDAQLKYLQAQINPHFLFNTLNAGAQLSMMEGADRTYEYIQNVAEFFRYNIKKGNENVTIREEIELVDHYMYILNVRFSGDIQYEKHIDESLLERQMPGMILQPIVENSVNHGIRAMVERGKIVLSVYHVDNAVCISISDNGKGMEQEDIEKILNGSYRGGQNKADSNGVGMDNVINRLKLFDEENVVDIVSEGPGKGTEVLIYLTDETREDEDV